MARKRAAITSEDAQRLFDERLRALASPGDAARRAQPALLAPGNPEPIQAVVVAATTERLPAIDRVVDHEYQERRSARKTVYLTPQELRVLETLVEIARRNEVRISMSAVFGQALMSSFWLRQQQAVPVQRPVQRPTGLGSWLVELLSRLSTRTGRAATGSR